MGLHIDVYRNAADSTDCTLRGVSVRFKTLTVVNIPGPFEPNDDYPAVFLDNHVSGCLRIVPAVIDGNGGWKKNPGWAMMGGNYGGTSDSRFADACAKLLGHRFYGAVPIHDRYETAEQYASHSD